VDPLAAKYASLSPYNYAFNNPVSLNDPTGADPYIDALSYGIMVSNGGSMGRVQQMADRRVMDLGGRGVNGGGSLINWGNAPSMFEMIRNAEAVKRGEMRLDDYGGKYGVSVNLYYAYSRLFENSNFIDLNAPNTAWFFDGMLVDITKAGTGTLLHSYAVNFGAPIVIEGKSPISIKRKMGGVLISWDIQLIKSRCKDFI
jgi:hypothetical protein